MLLSPSWRLDEDDDDLEDDEDDFTESDDEDDEDEDEDDEEEDEEEVWQVACPVRLTLTRGRAYTGRALPAHHSR